MRPCRPKLSWLGFLRSSLALYRFPTRSKLHIVLPFLLITLAPVAVNLTSLPRLALLHSPPSRFHHTPTRTISHTLTRIYPATIDPRPDPSDDGLNPPLGRAQLVSSESPQPPVTLSYVIYANQDSETLFVIVRGHIREVCCALCRIPKL